MRLIDADALEVFVKTVRQGLYLDKTLSDIPTRDSMLLNFQQYVHLQPTISAAPVVRCKDCKHGRYDEDSEMYDCGYVGLAIYNEPNHYCSYGERKEN